jgi:hypothetical protein
LANFGVAENHEQIFMQALDTVAIIEEAGNEENPAFSLNLPPAW